MLSTVNEGEFLEFNGSFTMKAFFSPYGSKILAKISLLVARKSQKIISNASLILEKFKKKNKNKKQIIEQFLFAAQNLDFTMKKIIAYHEIKKSGKSKTLTKLAHHKILKKLRKRFVELWKKHSRKSEINISLTHYKRALK
jgi:hypothetical protein